MTKHKDGEDVKLISERAKGIAMHHGKPLQQSKPSQFKLKVLSKRKVSGLLLNVDSMSAPRIETGRWFLRTTEGSGGLQRVDRIL